MNTPPELIDTIYDAPAPQITIASLADLVEAAATQGDAIAQMILERAAHNLARMLQAASYQLGEPARPVPLVLAGGTILHGSLLAQAFYQACAAAGMAFSSITPVPEPATGAVLLAKQVYQYRTRAEDSGEEHIESTI